MANKIQVNAKLLKVELLEKKYEMFYPSLEKSTTGIDIY